MVFHAGWQRVIDDAAHGFEQVLDGAHDEALAGHSDHDAAETSGATLNEFHQLVGAMAFVSHRSSRS